MSYRLEIFKDNPVVYLRLNDTDNIAKDHSGLGNHGTYVGGVLRRQQPIVSGDSWSILPGGGEVSLDFGYGVMLEGRERNSWAIELWLRPLLAPTATEQVFGRGDDGLYISPKGLTVQLSGQTMHHRINDWHTLHIVIGYGERTVNLHINGRNVASFAFEGVFTDDLFKIGSNNLLSEFAVYNKTLDVTRIQQHFVVGSIRQNYQDYLLGQNPSNYFTLRQNPDLALHVHDYGEALAEAYALHNFVLDEEKLVQSNVVLPSFAGTEQYAAGFNGQAIILNDSDLSLDTTELVGEQQGTFAIRFMVEPSVDTQGLFELSGVRIYRSGYDFYLEHDFEVWNGEEFVTESPLLLGSLADGWHIISLSWYEATTYVSINHELVAEVGVIPGSTLWIGNFANSMVPYQSAIDEVHVLDEFTAPDFFASDLLPTHYRLTFDGTTLPSVTALRVAHPLFVDGLDFNLTSVSWEASNNVQVEVSWDEGATWLMADNGDRIPGIPEDLEDAVLWYRQRVTGFGGDSLSSVELKFFQTSEIIDQVDALKSITLHDNATLSTTGVRSNGAGSLLLDAPGHTIEFWLRMERPQTGWVYILDARDSLDGAYLGINSSGAVQPGPGFDIRYTNGRQRSPHVTDLLPGQWTHIVLVAPTEFGSMRLLSNSRGTESVDAVIRDLAIYDRRLTLPEAWRNFQTGMRGRTFVTFKDGKPAINERRVDIYKQVWQSFGV